LSPLATSSDLHFERANAIGLFGQAVNQGCRDGQIVIRLVLGGQKACDRGFGSVVQIPSVLPMSLQPRRASCVCAARTRGGRERNHHQREPKLTRRNVGKTISCFLQDAQRPAGVRTCGAWPTEPFARQLRSFCSIFQRSRCPRTSPSIKTDHLRGIARPNFGLRSVAATTDQHGGRTRFHCSRDSSQRA